MSTVSELRVALRGLYVLAAGDLRRLWGEVSSPEEARQALEDVLPLLVETYGSASAALAADWYDEMRAELNVSGRFSAVVPKLGDRGADVLARWGVGPLFSKSPDWARARALVDGGLQLRLADAARETIQQSSFADPGAQGWQREASGGCGFCEMLAGRGVVYSESSASFASHDHCQCYAVPAFEGRPRLVRSYTPSERVASDADRARVREWLSEHSDD